MNKINSFTLLEVTVAMLLSAICIGICYTAFTLTNQYYAQIKSRKDEVGNILLMKQVLQHDFEIASKINKTEFGISCEMAHGTIEYQFKPECMVRNQYQLKNDTVKMAITNLVFKFEKLAIDSGLVDELTFNYSLKNKQNNIRFQKIYSATNLFN
ncbi:hypothetical protein GM921_00795 [Pedobacter sp. LMG 31464]|uniref:Prepilin-type N-terminal cleavage/methylation domain-containing protein n=1 Tax=Pedobacter planticolens TaxID=2679964 RepID=A0A923DWC1_9SPHI|nr:prepilin-type N-terminal cleavage/methylation domain-containing protein [Pedobacter planticolens]MBB2144008.1 hypothetical protein [Pedobacter planticolens]